MEIEPGGDAARPRSPGRALVTGATGALGPLLVRRLVERGWAVRAFCRRAPPPGLLVAEAEVFLGDITDPDAVVTATEGVSTVFHLAGLLHNPRPQPSEFALYDTVNVGGARNVARAAARSAASVIHFSTIAVYGVTAGGRVDETCAVAPLGPYATTKRRSEEVLLDAGLKTTALRLAAVYGRRMKGNYTRLIEALRKGRFVAVGDGSNRRTLVHEEDAVRAAIRAAECASEAAGIFNITDGATHSMNEILHAISSALGRPAPRWRVPEPLARVAAFGLGYRDVLDKYLENVEVSGERFQRATGFAPTFDLLAGWRDAVVPESRQE